MNKCMLFLFTVHGVEYSRHQQISGKKA